jgi:hypothetical protein
MDRIRIKRRRLTFEEKYQEHQMLLAKAQAKLPTLTRKQLAQFISRYPAVTTPVQSTPTSGVVK